MAKQCVKLFTFVTFCLLTFTMAAHADWQFDHQIIHVGLSRPDDCVAADMNGDGRLDIVVSEDDGIHWYMNLGGSRPKWKRSDPVDSKKRAFMGMWVGDFDADGDTDICASCKDDKKGYWFANNGEGTKWSVYGLPFSGDNADHSRCYDFNHDGRDDIVMQRYHGSGVFYMPAPANPRSEWKAYKIGTGRAGLSIHDVDNDGDMDVLVDNTWLENPGDPAQENWKVHNISNSASHVKNAAGDLNGDGVLDFAHAQEEGEVCYVVLSPAWQKVTLKSDGKGLHTMKLEDFDKDGDLDLFTADIHGGHAYIFENTNGRATIWKQHDLPTWSKEGSHNLWAADLNGDGMTDVFGKHYKTGSALEAWYNTLRPPPGKKIGLNKWTYKQITNKHERVFGLCFGDVTGDGRTDIISGKYIYENPGGDLTADWKQIPLPSADAFVVLNVDDDDLSDILAVWDNKLLWLEAKNKEGTSWTKKAVGDNTGQSHHMSVQGYKLARITDGAKPAIVLGEGKGAGIVYFQIPANPDAGDWPRVQIAAGDPNHRTQGVGVGDIDQDGRIDVVGCYGIDSNTAMICWWKNPGDSSGKWNWYEAGRSYGSHPDRIEAADLNNDGKMDIVVGDEGKGGKLYWLRQPAHAAKNHWPRHVIYDNEIYSMSVADMDFDGDMDVVVGEHKTQNQQNPWVGQRKTLIFENDGAGNFTAHVIDKDTEKESHLGTQLADLDGDGDYEIVSIGWRLPQYVHLWRNDN